MVLRIVSPLLVACLLAPATATAAIVHNEAVDGDFSGNGLAPTFVSVGAGTNTLIGGTGGGDRDYFSITVPAGSALTALFVREGTTVRGSSSFIGVQAGGQVTLPPDAGTAAGLLGWHLYATSDIGDDILPLMGAAGNGAGGFAPPLGSGTYAFWVQELGGATSYRFDLEVTPIPEPSAVLLLGLGIAVLGWRLARRRS